jgi:hypothetical protein
MVSPSFLESNNINNCVVQFRPWLDERGCTNISPSFNPTPIPSSSCGFLGGVQRRRHSARKPFSNGGGAHCRSA